MARRKDSEYRTASIVADAVGLTHLLVATAIIILGEYTLLLKSMGGKYNGVEFVYRYLDRPVYDALTPLLDWFGVGGNIVDRGVAMVTVSFVVIASSVAYGIIAYYLTRFVGALFASDN